MSDPAFPPRLTVDEYVAWAMQQPDGVRHELDDGVVVAMAPERSEHVDVKGNVYFRLRSALGEAGDAGCRAYMDGLAVRVDDRTLYEPDALVRCGARLEAGTLWIDDPLIVVEVVSPSSRTIDSGTKLEAYFRLASLRHYLVLQPEKRVVIHHARDAGGDILTRLIHDAPVRLDPPGIVIDALFD